MSDENNSDNENILIDKNAPLGFMLLILSVKAAEVHY